jgi:hypothetical protein
MSTTICLSDPEPGPEPDPEPDPEMWHIHRTTRLIIGSGIGNGIGIELKCRSSLNGALCE